MSFCDEKLDFKTEEVSNEYFQGREFVRLPLFRALDSSGERKDVDKHAGIFKLRLNLDQNAYEQRKKEIIEILEKTIKKFTSRNLQLVCGYKWFEITPQQLEENDQTRKLRIFQCLKNNDIKKARAFAKKIKSADDKKRYEGIIEEYNTGIGYKKSDLTDIIAERLKWYNPQARLIGGSQVTVHLTPVLHTALDRVILDVMSSNYCERSAPSEDYLSDLTQLTRLSGFVRALTASLIEAKIEPGSVAETDTKITSHVSLRQERFHNMSEYIPHDANKATLSRLKRAQEKSVTCQFLLATRNLRADLDYLWDKNTDKVRNVVNILKDYARSSNVALFFSGHIRRHHAVAIRRLINDIQTQQLEFPAIFERIDILLMEKGKINPKGCLAKRLGYITEHCIDEKLAYDEVEKFGNETEPQQELGFAV